MKKPFLRTLISAMLLSLGSGIVVTIIGFILGWKTSTQFSNGFFWVGAIMISVGLLSILGAKNHPVLFIPPTKPESTDRFKLWMSDTTRGYNTIAFLGIAGVLLFGQSALALLIGKLL